jgi:uncharacterized membrane protein
MKPHTDALDRLEHHLGKLFAIGLAVSATSLALGLVLFFLAREWTGTMWVLNAGLVVLMATPILRVVVSVVEYVRMRDWFFTLMTLVVLVELSVTLLYAWTRT